MRIEDSFKETEIGPIPVDWEVVGLGDIKHFRIRPSGIAKFDGRKSYLSTSSIQGWNIVSVEKEIEYDDRPSRANMQPIPNSVWFAKMMSTVKVYAFTEANQAEVSQYIMSTGFCGVECNNDLVDPEYTRLFFLSSYFNATKDSLCTGTTQRAINNQNIRAILIALPPLGEQRRIAHVLSTIQRAIAAQDNLIVAGKETKRSLMQRLFTYGPGPEPALTKETEIGEIPEHWEVVRVGDVFEIKLGKMLSKAARRGISPRPYLRNANVQWGYIDLSDVKEMDFTLDEMEIFRLRKDDVLVCEGGDIGRTAIWEEQMPECYYQKALHRLRPKEPNILPRFFLYYMMFIFLVRRVLIVEGARSTIAHLPVAKLRMVPLALPSFDEQIQVVEQINAVDRKIKAEEQRKAALRALFKTMLHQLMTGQVRVRNVEV